MQQNIMPNKPSKKITILVVDDDPSTVETLKTMEQKLGSINVLKSHNGFDAIAVAVEKNPDIILLDVATPFLDFRMPELNGIQTLKVLKEIDFTKHINVVMLFENIDYPNLAELLKIGATDCISKPFGRKILKEKLSKLYPNIFSNKYF